MERIQVKRGEVGDPKTLSTTFGFELKRRNHFVFLPVAPSERTARVYSNVSLSSHYFASPIVM